MSAPAAPPPAAAATASDLTEDGETIDGRAGELICVMPPTAAAASAPAGAAAGRDLRLSRLTDCTVVLLEPLRALRVDGLVRCHVYTGGVAGSLLLHGCRCAGRAPGRRGAPHPPHCTPSSRPCPRSDCVIVTAVRQARLHTSTRCDFYLHTASRPIIEHCRGLRFAPYTLRYDGVGAALAAAGLIRSSDSAALPGPADGPSAPWRQVDDFRWLRVQASPNWFIMPPSDWIRARGGADAAADSGSKTPRDATATCAPTAGATDVPEDMLFLRPAAAALGLTTALLPVAASSAAPPVSAVAATTLPPAEAARAAAPTPAAAALPPTAVGAASRVAPPGDDDDEL